jgi:hypothetical protein
VLKVSVKLDTVGLRRDLDRLKRNVVPKVISRALNRSADGVRAEAVRVISRMTKLKQADIRKRMFVKGATPQRLYADVLAYPLSPNLKQFRATQNKVGVAASAWERRKTYRHAFIHPRTGRVVTRETKERFPLKGLRGPSLPRTFMQQIVLARLAAVAKQRWRSEVEREAARRLRASMAGQ